MHCKVWIQYGIIIYIIIHRLLTGKIAVCVYCTVADRNWCHDCDATANWQRTKRYALN